jgi:cytochrome P450
MPKAAFPPGPQGSLILGNLREFGKGRLAFFVDITRRYGDIVNIRFGPRRIYLVSNPDLIEQVLVTDSKHYIKHFGARLYKPVLGNGLVTSEGDFWLRQRRLSQPAFLKNRVLTYAPVMTELTERMLAGWKDGDAADVHFEFSTLTSAIALRTLFGLDDPGGREEFTTSLRLAFDLMSEKIGALYKLPLWVPTRRNIRLKRAIAHLNRVVDGFIAAGKSRPPGNDLLSRLVAARDVDGSQMTDRQLRDEAMTLYLAGHETTALTLSWSWYLLAQHPRVEEKLLAEWQRVLGDRVPAAVDLPKMPYTDAVITEAMRVYPPVYLIGREATKDLELGGYRVRKGTTIFIPQWVSHRDPRYFPEPEEFRPERWEGGLLQKLPKYAYYPFGGGPRVCIGNTFAMMEAALILTTVGQKYHFTLEPEPPVIPNPQITLNPLNGIPAVLKKR